jgi:hypothetical protein
MYDEDDENSIIEGKTVGGEPLSQLPRHQIIDPHNRSGGQTLVPTNGNLKNDHIVSVNRSNHNQLDTFEFLQHVIGSDDKEEEENNNNYRGGDGSIDNVIEMK